MDKNLQYSTTIKSRPLLFIETKKLAGLVLRGFNEMELREQVIQHNIFQVKTETRKREFASTILNRFKFLDEYLIKQITESDMETGKVIVLYAIVKSDRLFYEFMNEVFSEKIVYQDLVLTDYDFNTFFEGKRQQSGKVADWKEYTFYKLQQVYIRILFEAGLLNNQKGEREILIPILNPEVLEHLRNTDDPRFINVIVGG